MNGDWAHLTLCTLKSMERDRPRSHLHDDRTMRPRPVALPNGSER